MRGVPIRLELGPRDLAAGTALMATRLGEGKTPVSLDSAPARLNFELTAFQDLLLRRATEFRDQRTVTVNTWEEFVAAVATGWARAFGCGQAECEEDIKAATSATPRVIPADGEPEQGTCIRCGLPVRLRQAAHLRPRILASRAARDGCYQLSWAIVS